MAFTGNYVCDTYSVGLPSGTFNMAAGTTQVFKIALYTNAATLTQSTTGYSTSGEVVGTGYVAGGAMLPIALPPTTGGSGHTAYLTFADVTWASATFTARGALLYLADGLINPAIIVLDFGADKIVSGTPFVVQFPAASSTSAIIRIEQGTP